MFLVGLLGNKALCVLQVSVIPSIKWAVRSLRSPLAPVPRGSAALASFFSPPTCCRFYQSFQTWGGGLRPKVPHHCLAVNTFAGSLPPGPAVTSPTLYSATDNAPAPVEKGPPPRRCAG